MTTTTFTLRMDPSEHATLCALADLDRITPAALARQIMAEGLRDRLEPEAIDRRMDALCERMQDAVRTLRDVQRRGTGTRAATTSRPGNRPPSGGQVDRR